MKTSKSLRYFVHGIYGYAFFNKLLLISPVYAIFMQNHGMSDMQLSVVLMMYSISTVVTQIPATLLTNRLGHKNALLLGQLLKGIGFTLWLVWPTFIGFAIGMFLWGVMSAFYGTAYESLIYDGLRARHHNHIYARVLGMRYNAQAVGAGLAAFGSLLMVFGYGWVTLASLVALALSMICISRVDLYPDGRKIVPKSVKRVDVKKLVKSVFYICRAIPCMFLMMALCLFVFNFSCIDDFLGPIGLEIGLPVQYVGLIQFFVLACMILGQTFAYRFTKIKDGLLYSSICLMGAMFALFSMNYSLTGLWILGVAYVVSRALHVLLYSRFQDFIPPSYRTIVLSVYNMLSKVVYTLMCLFMGFGGSLGSWGYGIFGAGIMIIVIGLWALCIIGNRCSCENVRLNKNAIKTLHPVGSDFV